MVVLGEGGCDCCPCWSCFDWMVRIRVSISVLKTAGLLSSELSKRLALSNDDEVDDEEWAIAVLS